MLARLHVLLCSLSHSTHTWLLCVSLVSALLAPRATLGLAGPHVQCHLGGCGNAQPCTAAVAFWLQRSAGTRCLSTCKPLLLDTPLVTGMPPVLSADQGICLGWKAVPSSGLSMRSQGGWTDALCTGLDGSFLYDVATVATVLL